MSALADVPVVTRPLSERLNRECTCVTLDRDALCAALELRAGVRDLIRAGLRTKPLTRCTAAGIP
jgi:hypothetical protein